MNYWKQFAEMLGLEFEKEKKLIGIGFYKINVNTLEAINKQCEELGWMQSHAK